MLIKSNTCKLLTLNNNLLPPNKIHNWFLLRSPTEAMINNISENIEENIALSSYYCQLHQKLCRVAPHRPVNISINLVRTFCKAPSRPYHVGNVSTSLKARVLRIISVNINTKRKKLVGGYQGKFSQMDCKIFCILPIFVKA